MRSASHLAFMVTEACYRGYELPLLDRFPVDHRARVPPRLCLLNIRAGIPLVREQSQSGDLPV